ncbi:hypothetical protein B5X24_HaOG211989 [Helicoverpa armigera]|uniref:Uncharacterized protein n=1 Tax=Helicoverpa armigera TaxID=29058 RepID=A0A2W1B8B4_HELAM|nr:hypothetical protein B5X24_HaOG211989 [Helicoverpa armigera]
MKYNQRLTARCSVLRLHRMGVQLSMYQVEYLTLVFCWIPKNDAWTSSRLLVCVLCVFETTSEPEYGDETPSRQHMASVFNSIWKSTDNRW